ncbi:MAG: TlpA family protein disulfide reductase [Wenzhouxiangella sp.]|nr:MAG: TlpA family protein disulfide reductase [Wenzhouxiangella sp.]
MKSTILVALLAACLLAGPALADDPIEVELPSLAGETVRLSDYRGDWVVLNYWATWCAPCRKEIPDLSRLHDAHADITVLGLAFEDTDPEDFVAFLEQYPASYPILLVDTFDPPESLGAPRALPTTFLVDRGGVIVNTWLGPITSTMITDWIDEHGR